jgi:ech hydrogenase subunit C
MSKYFTKSPWIIHYDATSCNGCDIEVLACLTPLYDVERFGIINTGNPKHADIFLITGSVNEQNKEVIQNIYYQMPDPKVVVAIGICASSGGIFAECYNVMGGVDKVIPVDVYVPGCAARPEAIIDGVVKALGVLEEKRKKMHELASGKVKAKVVRATQEDAEEILRVQRIAFRSEAELHNDFSITPLKQTLEDIQQDLKDKIVLKAVIDGQLVGSVRAHQKGDEVHIQRLFVNPSFQNQGIATLLMEEIEKLFPGAKKFECHTGPKSRRNIFLYNKLGYKMTRKEKVENRHRVYLEKVK